MLKELSEGLQTKIFLPDLSQTERLNDSMVEAFQRTIVTSFQSWLEKYPIASWLIEHPLWILCIFLLLLLLFGGLLRVIGRLTEETWLIILQFPFRLAQWLVNLMYKAFTNAFTTSKATNLNFGKNDKQEQLMCILLRLEEIKQEQEELIKEMKAILNSPDP